MKQKIEKLITDKIQDGVAEHGEKVSSFIKLFPEVNKFIILIDIVSFSKKPTHDQMSLLLFFQFVLKNLTRSSRFKYRNEIKIEGFIPTGDGCYMVAKECDEKIAVEFLISIIEVFEKIQLRLEEKISLRVSGLLGKCMPFIDIARHKNYIGEGMNEAERVMSGGRKCLDGENIPNENTVFVDSSLEAAALAYKEKYSVYKFKEVADKHGKKRDVTAVVL